MAVALAMGAAVGSGTGLVSGIWTIIQGSKRETLLKGTFINLKVKLDEIENLYEDNAVDAKALSKSVDEVLRIISDNPANNTVVPC